MTGDHHVWICFLHENYPEYLARGSVTRVKTLGGALGVCAGMLGWVSETQG